MRIKCPDAPSAMQGSGVRADLVPKKQHQRDAQEEPSDVAEGARVEAAPPLFTRNPHHHRLGPQERVIVVEGQHVSRLDAVAGSWQLAAGPGTAEAAWLGEMLGTAPCDAWHGVQQQGHAAVPRGRGAGDGRRGDCTGGMC